VLLQFILPSSKNSTIVMY